MNNENPEKSGKSSYFDQLNDGMGDNLLKNDTERKVEEYKQKENKGENEDINNQIVITLKRPIRWLIFIIFILTNILVNLDHGIIPSATGALKRDLKLNDSELGLFGSLVFVGNIIGSMISVSLINNFNRKHLIIICLILCGICLYGFTLLKNTMLLYFNRILVGMFQSYISIYLPVWCDQFGVNSKRTMMIAMIQVAPPLGVVIGYGINFLFEDFECGWKYPFRIQSGSTLFLAIATLVFPNKYFSNSLIRYKGNQEESPEIKPSLNTESSKDESTSIAKNSEKEESNSKETKETQSDISMFIGNLNDSEKNKRKLSSSSANGKMSKQIKEIFCQPIFIFCVLTLSVIFFVLTSVQYWASDYMEVVLNVTDSKKRLISFGVVCLTSPTLGVLVGGLIINLMGGYETKHSIIFCLICSILSTLSSIPVPLVKSLLYFTIGLWLVLFFGGAILAPLTGINITSLPKELGGMANSFTFFFTNLLGYMPAPFIYGLLKTYFNSKLEEENTNFPMMICMWYAGTGIIFLIIAAIFRYKNYNMLYDIKSSIEEKKDNNLFPEKRRNSVIDKTMNTIQKDVPKIFNGMTPKVETIKEKEKSDLNIEDAMIAADEQIGNIIDSNSEIYSQDKKDALEDKNLIPS